MKRAILLLAFLSAACSEDRSLAPTAPACTGVGCANNTGVIGGGGGTNDASVTDSATDALAADAGAQVTAIVRAVARYTDDPAGGAPVTSGIIVRAEKLGGGSTDSTIDSSGVHTLRDVAHNSGAAALTLLTGAVIRAIDLVRVPDPMTINLPLFPDALEESTWGLLLPGTTIPANTGHLVVHVLKGGTRMAGVTASSTSSAKGPFYDDGSDIAAGRTSTGARGTVLFMGAPAGTMSVVLTAPTGSFSATVAIAASAVTHFTATMP